MLIEQGFILAQYIHAIFVLRQFWQDIRAQLHGGLLIEARREQILSPVNCKTVNCERTLYGIRIRYRYHLSLLFVHCAHKPVTHDYQLLGTMGASPTAMLRGCLRLQVHLHGRGQATDVRAFDGKLS